MINTRDRTLSSTGDEDQLEDEEKKMNVSIDCTKALVIFGFSNWSELEPGNYKFSTISFSLSNL